MTSTGAAKPKKYYSVSADFADERVVLRLFREDGSEIASWPLPENQARRVAAELTRAADAIKKPEEPKAPLGVIGEPVGKDPYR